MSSAVGLITEQQAPGILRKFYPFVGGLFLLTLLWMNLAYVDVGVTTAGSIQIKGKTQSVFPHKLVQIKEITPIEGQLVNKGDLLVEFDFAAEQQRLNYLLEEKKFSERYVDAYRALLFDQYIKQNDIAYHLRRKEESRQLSLEQEINKLQWQIQKNVEQQRLKNRLYLIAKRQLDGFNTFSVAMDNAYERRLKHEENIVVIEEGLEKLSHRRQEIDMESSKLETEKIRKISEVRLAWYRGLNQHQSRLTQLVAEILQLKKEVSKTKVYAQDNGVITTVANVLPDSWVNVDKPVIVLEKETSGLRVKVDVPVDQLIWSKTSKSIVVTLNEFPRNRYGYLEVEFESYNTEIKEVENHLPFYEVYLSIKVKKLKNMPKNFSFVDGQSVRVVFGRDERSVFQYLIQPLTKGLDRALVDPHAQ